MPGDILSEDGSFLQLRSAFPQLFEAKYGPEPRVPYREYASGSEFFAPAPFDILSLAVSPRYSPKEADGLIDEIMAFAHPA